MQPLTKKCSICKSVKSIDEFAIKGKRRKSSRCRKCENKRRQTKLRTKHGLATKIYRTQKKASTKRGHPQPTYSLNELREWMLSQETYHKLHAEWVASGYDKMKVPSCDRLNDYKGYSFDNIQLVTWQENRNKSDMDRVIGRNNKTNRSIKQYSLSGEFIQEFHSHQSAARAVNGCASSIGMCRRGVAETHKGFKWGE